jgi:hypothetical protein
LVLRHGHWFKARLERAALVTPETNRSNRVFLLAKLEPVRVLLNSRRATIVLRLDPKNPEKYSVITIGYVTLEICLRGPQFRGMVAANLAVFASVSAGCDRRLRNLNGLSRRVIRVGKSLP